MNALPLPLILGVKGLALTGEERAFFKHVNPLGFILFRHNIDTPLQTKNLIAEMKEVVGRNQVHIMVDAEGGRVWRFSKAFGIERPPPAAVFGITYQKDPQAALKACYTHYKTIALFLKELGFTLNPVPVLDLYLEGMSDVVGDRAFSGDSDIVGALGGEVLRAMRDGGLFSVMKHMPGHGAALVDSHEECPRVTLSQDALKAHFQPFRFCNHAPFGMAAHIIYESIDPLNMATFSKKLVKDILREDIGFKGCLMTDDLYMGALQGVDPSKRVQNALDAGFDVALYGRGGVDVYKQAVKRLLPMCEKTFKRVFTS